MKLKNLLPSSFPAGNTHRVVLFQAPTEPPEFERLEEMTADAAGHIRDALALIDALPGDHSYALQGAAKELRWHLDERRVLNDCCQLACDDFLDRVCQIQQELGAHEVLAAIHSKVAAAVRMSRRVGDLLAAEKDVGWHRGLRTGS
jgi:hypothetical protein